MDGCVLCSAPCLFPPFCGPQSRAVDRYPRPSITIHCQISLAFPVFSASTQPRPHDLLRVSSIADKLSAPFRTPCALHALIVAFIYQFRYPFPDAITRLRAATASRSRLSRIGALEITTGFLPCKRVGRTWTIFIAFPTLRLGLRELACDGRTPLCFGLA